MKTSAGFFLRMGGGGRLSPFGLMGGPLVESPTYDGCIRLSVPPYFYECKKMGSFKSPFDRAV